MSVQEVKRRNQKKNTKPLKLASCDTRNHVQAYFDLRDNLVHGTFCLGTFSIVGQSVMGQFARDFLSGDSLSWDKLTVHGRGHVTCDGELQSPKLLYLLPPSQ